ncbi:ankyrin repeat domain-containing protein 34B [Denticeps clupeoides]|uniref:Ankyrin repeat domain-containing protein 34B n=1 Tax=Denticeps clupeoides TaxID=299321 RepID=A0AAY4EA56_9TELE|nr:ankyrin repeat domain-containing protein 34B-like [Denticeps clupeoides]
MEAPQAVHTGASSLLKAVYLSRLRLTRLLLEGGAYINESNELGETPLMLACKSKPTDQQSVSKVKMVQYLLESGADPNIQDKNGKTALMHACLEKAGVDVVSLLLESGADPCLEDHSGSSTLVYAIKAKDKEILKTLMSACKARGKEVIIITTDKQAAGKHMTKQYLNTPPQGSLEPWDHLTSPGQLNSPACASPSDIQLHSSEIGGQDPLNAKTIFSFQDCHGTFNSQPSSPTQTRGMHDRVNKLHLQRLQSEPWLHIPTSFTAQQQVTTLPPMVDLPDINPEEEQAFRVSEAKRLSFAASYYGYHHKEAISLKLASKIASNPDGGRMCRKMSFDSLSLAHSLSNPNLHSKSGAEVTGADREPDKLLPNLAVSSLRNVISRRNFGMDHYSSDSQLAHSSLDDGKLDLEKRAGTSRFSTLMGSQEHLKVTPPAHKTKRPHVGLERRSSGATYLDQVQHLRPGYLPPLSQHALVTHKTGGNIPNVSSSNKPPCSTLTGQKPGLLMRRHSMQTEQIKQLGDFQELFGH